MKYMLFSWPDDPYYGSNPVWGLYDTVDEAVEAAIKYVIDAERNTKHSVYKLRDTIVVRDAKKMFGEYMQIDINDPATGDTYARIASDYRIVDSENRLAALTIYVTTDVDYINGGWESNDDDY